MQLKSKPRQSREPTIALINVVFLMLIFFMIAGTLTPPLNGSVQLVETMDLEGREPPDALVIRADGTLEYRGAELTNAAAYVERAAVDLPLDAVRIVPDRSLPAVALKQISDDLRGLGASQVYVVTERGLR
ncbi:ExbD/TolR family protein [Ruegeria faecimaris]|uniref:Biopolymer transport protein ExbD n=1 Tax=Ruegeria faecimaris TaxID=686389 RepID=A0A521DR05_9RHOB|nr:biopolymer transporter ExbD [Ruegeria faecimaris]SMO74157.1 biopolymer transport protein ExbD [Ruegeria faecimaris]